MKKRQVECKQSLRDGVPFSYADSISEMLLRSGKFDEAEEISRLTIEATISNYKMIKTKQTRKAIGIAYGTLGNILLCRGNLDEALNQYNNTLEIYDELNERTEGAGTTYINLGALYELKSDFRKAIECWSKARCILDELGYPSESRLLKEWIKDLQKRIGQGPDSSERLDAENNYSSKFNGEHASLPASSKPRGSGNIFISVKYNHDHIIERSLTAFLKKNGYDTFFHKGTTDILKRGALPPILSQEGGLTIVMPTLFHERQMEPESVSPQLVQYLTEQVCNHDLVIIVWSNPYKSSFWTMLEMKAALLARKPIIVIKTDDEDLHRELSDNSLCRVVEITADYKTSAVASLVSSMLSILNSTESFDFVYQRLQDFANREYQGKHSGSPFSQEDLTHYHGIVSRLRMADERGNLHNEIVRLDRMRLLDDNLRKYFEYVIGGQIKAQWEDWQCH